MEARAEAEAAFIGGRWLSGGSNDRRKWARAEYMSIGPRAEAIHLSGGGGIPCRAETEEVGEEGGGRAGVEGKRRAEEVSIGPRAEEVGWGK